MDIVDCHVHPFATPESNCGGFAKGMTPDDFVAELRRCGVTRCCGSVIRRLSAPTIDDIRALNREALALRDRFPDFIVPGIHALPAFPEASCREIETLHREAGVRWVGEIVGYMMGCPSYLGTGAFAIYDLAQQLDLPVNIHPGPLEEMETICQNFPRLKLVLAHPCDGDEMKRRFDFVRRHAAAHLDLSGTGLFRWGMLRHGIDVAGPEKFLFGSDFPICNPAMQVQGVLFEHLSEREREAVFSGNFRRLTGLPG
jgi:predicted TIM-barrel fold metal-dependent hydrolase